ncbi:uncharacterized protein LOC114067593 [Empidonax traillii]|uniref:uncharacterized protein LOC114067593 n=1 Tax=Empidonax traillii TaxID=164674 RepID=UPI000FFD9D3D|nr:uncharacterized protein LOC114067593 [Empidonax traillii]
MAKRPPAFPRQAWMEDSSSQESRSPSLQLPSPYEVTTMQPLKFDASWLPIYEEEQEAVDSILAFVTSPSQEERDKVTFLRSISMLCRSAVKLGLTQGLDFFSDMYQLAENIKALLEEEPRDRLCTEIRHLSMLALEKLSLVDAVLEGKAKSLLRACFSSVFWLPAEKEMPKEDLALYVKTLNSMDSMLRTMVLSFPASRVSEELQGILEVLLDFTRCEREAVRERAMVRIDVLIRALFEYSTLQVRTRPPPARPSPIPASLHARAAAHMAALRDRDAGSAKPGLSRNAALGVLSGGGFGTNFVPSALLLVPPPSRPVLMTEEAFLDLALQRSNCQC